MAVVYLGKTSKAAVATLLSLIHVHVACVDACRYLTDLIEFSALAQTVCLLCVFVFDARPALGRRSEDILQHARQLYGGKGVSLQTRLYHFFCCLYSLMWI